MPDPSPSPTPGQAEQLARRFHETYEALAPSFGYATREASAVAWENVPEPNKSLIIAVAKHVLASSPLLADGLSEKLDEMNLYDDTGDPQDVGYMMAVQEIRDWLARLVSAPNREEPDA